MEIIANILLVGPTRSGKDSFINTIAQKIVAKEGANNFQSTTKEPQKYLIDLFNKKSLIINTQGFGDTAADQSDKQIGEITELFILQESNMNQIDLFILFEPLDSNVLQTKQTYLNLVKIFGEQVKKSVIVLCSKIDKSIKMGDYDDRKEIEHQISQELQLPILYWQNDTLKQKVGDVQRQTQMEDLRTKILKIIPYQVPSLIQKRERIKNLAIQLMNNAPIEYVPYTYQVTVQIPYIFPHTYEVTVQVPYTDVENYTEAVKKTIVVPKQRTEQVFTGYKRGGWGRMFGKKRAQYEDRVVHYLENQDIIENVQKSRNLTKYKPVQQSKIENITKYKPEQQSKTENRMKDKDINLFMVIAKKQILLEMWNNVKKIQK